MKLFGLFVALLLFAVGADAGVSMNNPFYCYATDWIRPQIQFHAVRSSYEAIRRTETNPLVSTCTPFRFWYLGRHGGRNPETALLNRMFAFADSSIQSDIQRNSDLGRSTLCREDLDMIRSWTRNMNISIEHQSRATVSGWTAMQNIARRYQQFYPTLLPNVYNRDWYLFRHTSLIQTHGAIQGFVDGLFGDGFHTSVFFEPVPPNDWFMIPFFSCPAFNQEVAGRRAHLDYLNSPEVEQMLTEINRRLGFQGSNQLSFDTVFTMWEWCRFELASLFEVSGSPIGPPSAWCAPFTVVHHEVLEYFADLDYYYFTGYGVQSLRLVQNMMCGLIQDLLLHIQGLPAGDPIAKIYVSHQQMLHFFLTSLEAMRDNVPLHHQNFAQQSFRQWRTGFMTPNAGNIAVITYACPGGDNDVYFLMNERPLVIPGCNPNGVCKASFLLNRLQRFIGVNCQTFFCTSQ